MARVPDYLEAARVLQGRLRDLTAGDSSTKLRKVLEIAAEEFGIQRDEYVCSSSRSKTSSRGEAVGSRRDVGEEQSCRHLCYEHKEVMNPDHWGTLPHDLLQLVFAHLPVNEILLLRSLSNDWEKTMGTDSDFFRACDEAHPKMFALLSQIINIHESGKLFLVRVFDAKLNTWHALQISSGDPEAGWGFREPRWRGMGCEDGGLALFYLEAHAPKKKGAFRSLFYKVINPLTRRSRELPPILDVVDVNMKHIIVDRETNCYKVLIVVDRRAEGDPPTEDIQVFDSQTGEWSQPNDAMDVMFGNQSAYDFANGRLIEQYGSARSPWNKKNVESYTFLKNRLFVLRKDTDGPASEVSTNRPSAMYYIREYSVEYHPQHPPTWLEVEIHRCVPFERTPKGNDYKLMLHSSNGLLIVFAAIIELEPYRSDRGWIYDLSTRNWRDLPEFPGEPVWMRSDQPCEIRWNAHP